MTRAWGLPADASSEHKKTIAVPTTSDAGLPLSSLGLLSTISAAPPLRVRLTGVMSSVSPSSDPAESGVREELEWAPVIARVRAGDSAALGAIFHAFVLPLCAYAARAVRSRETAAELVQDVFYRIWRGRANWEVGRSLRAYLYRATRNRALDYLRHERLERRWAEHVVREPDAQDRPRVVPADEAVETQEMVSALSRALDGLPERRRLVFVLRWREGLSHQEIADRMGVTVKTVENQLTRAIQALRARLGPNRSG